MPYPEDPDPEDVVGFPAAERQPMEVSRRKLLVGSAALLAFSAVRPLDAFGDNIGALSVDDFLRLSRIVTGQDQLNPSIGARILTALQDADPKVAHQLVDLVSTLNNAPTAEELLEAADRAGTAGLIHEIAAAWYTGTVRPDDHAVVVAYFGALMYRTVADGLPVPTYCSQSGIWWQGDPPPVGVSPPQRQPGNVTP
jgi:hypothetical protein